MEELGLPDSAMLYYKYAEATADEKDYTNLAYINIRIADLYRRYYADQEICFEKYRQALSYYKLTGDVRQQQNCLFNMANNSGISSVKNYKLYYQQAYNLAVDLNDSLRIYQCQEFCCRHLYPNDSTIEEAKNIALSCINNYPKYVEQNLLIDLAFIYIHDNKLDSAKYYLSMADVSNRNSQDKMRYYWATSMLLNREGDTIKSNYYSNLKSAISDSIDNNTEKDRIQHIENVNNSELTKLNQEKISTLGYMLWLILGGSVIAIAIVIIYHFRKSLYFRSIIHELEHIRSTNVNRHEELLQEIGNKDSVIGQFVQNMVDFMQRSIDINEKDSPTVIKRRMRETIKNVMTEDFWKELRAYLDRNHNNIISRFSNNNKLTENDIKFIELSCCGFGYIEIAVALGYSPKYISTKRKLIAKKLGIKEQLQEYLHKKMCE